MQCRDGRSTFDYECRLRHERMLRQPRVRSWPNLSSSLLALRCPRFLLCGFSLSVRNNHRGRRGFRRGRQKEIKRATTEIETYYRFSPVAIRMSRDEGNDSRGGIRRATLAADH